MSRNTTLHYAGHHLALAEDIILKVARQLAAEDNPADRFLGPALNAYERRESRMLAIAHAHIALASGITADRAAADRRASHA
jgi:hypothetical protein